MSFPILEQKAKHFTKPKWIRIKNPSGKSYNLTQKNVHSHQLHTICEEALCPNKSECWHHGTATFLLLGDVCTRGCKFCNVKTGRPGDPDTGEPQRIAKAAESMNLRHIVLTSVNRDDLCDGGALQYRKTIQAIKKRLPDSTIEVLVPDFLGNWDALCQVVHADITILNHNLETVSRLYKTVRPGARYERSLELIGRAKEQRPDVTTKSGIMVGLGESRDEIIALMEDLRKVNCEILTIGQYLQPTPRHHPVVEYIPPERFADYQKIGLEMGFLFVESGPFVRSSYHAWKHVNPRA